MTNTPTTNTHRGIVRVGDWQTRQMVTITPGDGRTVAWAIRLVLPAR